MEVLKALSVSILFLAMIIALALFVGRLCGMNSTGNGE